MKSPTKCFLMLAGIAAIFVAAGCGGDSGDGMDDTMMPVTGDGGMMMPETGDADMMMPEAGDGDMMMPETGDADMMMPEAGDGDMMMPETGDGDMMQVGLDGGLTQSPQPPVYADSDTDTLASSLPSGETVFSPLSAAILLDHGGEAATRPARGAFYVKSISGDGAGGFHVISVLDGEETPVHIEAGDHDDAAFGFVRVSEDEQSVYYLASWTGAFNEDPGGPAATDRTDGSSEFDYLELGYWLHYIGSDSAGAGPDAVLQGEGHDSFVTYGMRTRPGNLPTGNATYEGRLTASWWGAEGDPNTNLNDVHLQGALTLGVDFGDGTISGRVDTVAIPSWNSDSGGDEPVGAISIAGTGIDEAQFVVDWVGENSDTDAAPDRTLSGFTGTILGEFYGPAAEEVGGVLSGLRAATGTTQERYLTGNFGASQPDSGP